MPTRTDTFQGTPRFDRHGRDIPAIVSLEEAHKLLLEPIPVAFVGADGTVLACNALAAWLCNVPAASAFLLQNVYDYSATFILSERIPLACNHAFRLRKLAALHEADPGRNWPSHRRLYSAVSDAERRYMGKSCPVADCVETDGNDSWRYPLCIREPDTWPGGSPQQLLQFRVADSLIGLAGAPRDIPSAEKRFLIVFEPGNEHTSSVLGHKLLEFNRHFNDCAYIAPSLDSNSLIEYLEMSVNNSVQYITEYIEYLGIMKEDINRTQIGKTELRPDALPVSEAEGQEQVGTLLRRLRARRQMSAEELGKHLGFSRASVGHWEQGRGTPPQDPRLVRALVDALNPSDAEREQLTKLILGLDGVMDKVSSEDVFYEDMLRRTDLMMRLGAQIVAMQTELDREVSLVRSAVLDRYLRSNRPVTPEEAESIRDSRVDASVNPKRKASD